MGCYSFGDLEGPASLAILGGPDPVGTTGDGSRERLLGGSVSQLTKKTGCFILRYSTLIGLHWRLEIYCLLRNWCRIQLYPMEGIFERCHRLFSPSLVVIWLFERLGVLDFFLF